MKIIGELEASFRKYPRSRSAPPIPIRRRQSDRSRTDPGFQPAWPAAGSSGVKGVPQSFLCICAWH